ncbi:glutamate receptor ionotropic, delta-1 [Calliopsis andreniformis]|uniref:glutamate receptor ionotropic, delta-1 n=1 Tax=Calliopsis andreniformis TaxID=337506 RepID=UPI003FCE74E9
MALQKYLSGSLSIRTSIINFQMFKKQIGSSYYHIKRPLFVLLNDLDKTRDEFTLLSEWIDMAYPTWLLFLRDDTIVEDFLSKVHVPFDCTLLVAQKNAEEAKEMIVRDFYRISKNDHLRAMNFGSWNERHGFRGPRLGLYQRRNDLQGWTIRVVSIHDPPISRILKDDANRTIGIGGFFGEVIQLLQKGMNCTFSYDEANTWGVRLPNGTWTGSMKMLMDGEADLAAAEMLMTSDRLNAIKFTTPVYSTKARVYIKRPDAAAVKWNAYSAPFAINIWNAIGLTIVIAGLTIAVIDAFSRKPAHEPSYSTLLEIIFYVFGAFCSQGMEQSSLDPVRMVHLSIHMTAVVVLAAYSAALISFLAIKTFAMPFTTMEGLLADGTYRFAVVAESADYSFFQNTNDRILTVMFDELLAKEVDLPNNYLDGLTRVCDEEKYAFMTLDNMAGVLQGLVDCTLEPLDSMMQTTIAMAVSAHSPYRGIIDSNILLLRDSGILQRLLKTQWATNTQRSKTGWTSVELEDAIPLLVFLLLAFFITCLVLLLERLIHGKLSCRLTIPYKFFPKRRSRLSKQERQHRPERLVSGRKLVNASETVFWTVQSVDRSLIRMPPVRPAAASRAKASSREILAPGGKENARPSTNVSKKVPASGHRDEIRRRLSLSSNDERKKENGSVKTAHVISESFPVKKTPFHVHCDEKNVENSEPPERSKTASVLDVKESANLTNKEDRKQVIRGLDALSSTRKSLTDTVSKEGRRLLPPSRIPRRFRLVEVS